MRRNALAVFLSLFSLLAIPALAGAHPVKRDFNHTYPHAARLCARVAAGHAPARLAASADKVKAACDTLHASFTDAQTALTTTVTPLRQQANDALVALRATCKQARADHDPAACQTARDTTRATVKGLRAQVRAAAKPFHEAIRAARKAFWTTIGELRGGSSVAPDATSPPAPSVTMPTDAEVKDAYRRLAVHDARDGAACGPPRPRCGSSRGLRVPAEPAEIEQHARLGALGPGVVPGRHVERLARREGVLGAVVHADGHAARDHVADVRDLAAVGAGQRLDVVGPAPARLERPPPDRTAAEVHQVHPAVRGERPHLVRSFEPLRLET